MASIYATSIRPAWSNVNTYIAFYGATFAMGSVSATALIAYGSKGKKLSSEAVSLLKMVCLLGGLAVVLPLIYFPVYLSGLGNAGGAALASLKMISGSYAFLLVVRYLISITGVALLDYGVSKQVQDKGLPINIISSALLLVLLGEIIGRYVFYASAVSIMVG